MDYVENNIYENPHTKNFIRTYNYVYEIINSFVDTQLNIFFNFIK